MTPVTIGLGCDRGAALATFETALADATGALGEIVVCAVATIDRKGDEVAILELCAKHGWPLRLYPAAALAQVAVPCPSATVLRVMGTPAVAEAAALLAAGTQMDDLLVAKHKYRGADGKHVTVSIARCRHPLPQLDGA